MPTISDILQKPIRRCPGCATVLPDCVCVSKVKKPDLFAQFDCLFRGETIEDPPHPVVLNRFLASDSNYAEGAKHIIGYTWDPKFTWALWLSVLPKLAHGAPRMRYTAAKKGSDKPSVLVHRVMVADGIRRELAEEKIAMAALMDERTPELAHVEGAVLQLEYYYGVDPTLSNAGAAVGSPPVKMIHGFLCFCCFQPKPRTISSSSSRLIFIRGLRHGVSHTDPSAKTQSRLQPANRMKMAD